MNGWADPDFVRDEREASSLTEVIRLHYTPTRDCDICERRPSEFTVSFDGAIKGMCGTCWERIDDERGA